MGFEAEREFDFSEHLNMDMLDVISSPAKSKSFVKIRMIMTGRIDSLQIYLAEASVQRMSTLK